MLSIINLFLLFHRTEQLKFEGKKKMADNYNKKEEEAQTANVPVIDMNGMHDPAIRHRIVNDISKACLSYGIFQVSYIITI